MIFGWNLVSLDKSDYVTFFRFSSLSFLELSEYSRYSNDLSSSVV